jgi:hypothetical protein
VRGHRVDLLGLERELSLERELRTKNHAVAALHVVATPYAVAGSYTTLLDTTSPGPSITKPTEHRHAGLRVTARQTT